MKSMFALAVALLAGLLLAGCNKEDPKGFPKVDYNKDGRIIFEELIVVFPDLTVDEFLAADADGNGILTEPEYNRFRQARDSGKKLDASSPPLAPPAAKPAEPAKPAESAPAPAAAPPAATPQPPAAPPAPEPQTQTQAAPPAPEPAAEAVETVVAESAPAKAAPAAATTYTVARGDNVSRIAKKFGITPKELMAANDMKDADRLEAGKVLTIPGPGQAGPAETAGAARPAVAAFVADYFAKSSGGDLTALIDLYGQTVDYYKKGKVGSDVVRQDKAVYFERWPERTYTTAAPTVKELAGGDLKVVVAADYVVKRADKSARGQATFTLTLRPAGGSYRIIGEQSVVTERK